jgi:hypothetical protein
MPRSSKRNPTAPRFEAIRYFQSPVGGGLSIRVIGPLHGVAECIQSPFLLPGPTWKPVQSIRKPRS